VLASRDETRRVGWTEFVVERLDWRQGEVSVRAKRDKAAAGAHSHMHGLIADVHYAPSISPVVETTAVDDSTRPVMYSTQSVE